MDGSRGMKRWYNRIVGIYSKYIEYNGGYWGYSDEHLRDRGRQM